MKIIQGIAMLLLTAALSYWGKKNLDKTPLSNVKETVSIGITELTDNNTITQPLIHSTEPVAKQYKKNETEKYYRINEINFCNGGNAGN